MAISRLWRIRRLRAVSCCGSMVTGVDNSAATCSWAMNGRATACPYDIGGVDVLRSRRRQSCGQWQQSLVPDCANPAPPLTRQRSLHCRPPRFLEAPATSSQRLTQTAWSWHACPWTLIGGNSRASSPLAREEPSRGAPARRGARASTAATAAEHS